MMVVFVMALLSVLAVGLSGLVTSETQSTGHTVSSDEAYQAAEAGVDTYASYLLDDHLYFLHYVAPGESTRTDGTVTAAPGTDASGNVRVGKHVDGRHHVDVPERPGPLAPAR